jgi:hypothetical protein
VTYVNVAQRQACTPPSTAPRSASGIPFHKNSEAVVTEKIYADKANPNILHDEITTTDHALTRPWTVTRRSSAMCTAAISCHMRPM